MKRLFAQILFLLPLWFVQGAVFAGQAENLLANPGFEAIEDGRPAAWRLDYWDKAYPPVVTLVAGRDSGHAVEVVNDAPNDTALKQAVEVEPGRLYRFSAWVRVSGAGEGDRGASLSEAGITATSPPVRDTAGEWIRTEWYGRTGPDQIRLTLTLRLGAYGGLSKGRAAFDDLAFTPVSTVPPGVNPVSFARVSPGPEKGPERSERDHPFYPAKALVFILAVGILLIPAVYSGRRKSLFGKPADISLRGSFLLLFATWGVLLIFLFLRAMAFRDDGLYAGYEHIWADWPLHIGIAHIFADHAPGNWFANHPMYWGERLNYPFLADLVSGLLLKTGLSLSAAFIVPSCVTILLLLSGLHLFAYQLTRSARTAYLSVSLFLLSSGLGLYRYMEKAVTTEGWGAAFGIDRYYTRFDEYAWYSGNIIHGILLPQRGYLLGMALALISLAGLMRIVSCRERFSRRHRWELIGCGLLTGLLPIAHMHSFIVMFVVAGLFCLFSLRQLSKLLFYVVPAGLLSTALFLTFVHGHTALEYYFSWQPGWVSEGDFSAWLLMWFKLFGLMVPFALVGLMRLWGGTDWSRRGVYLGFFLLFILANLIRLQPVPWDNSKLFFWCYLGFSVLAADLLISLWRRNGAAAVVAAVLFLSFVATGALDVMKMTFGERRQYRIENSENIALAREIRRTTREEDLFLTDTSHAHFIMTFAGRPIVMGFTGWMENFGFEWRQREADMKAMFRGTPEGEALLRRYGVSYLVIGEGEKQRFGADEAYFRERYPLAFQNRHYRLYDVRGPDGGQ